jgi:predicted nucleotidyltransferase
VYLYGSSVVGGLQPASDLDLFAVAKRSTTLEERRALVATLIPISRRGQRLADWRPVELTIVAAPELTPWRYPPRTDFQYGEWLRDRFDSGDVDPEHPNNPDLALLIEMVRRTGVALHGPAARDVLPAVPASDLLAALVGVVPDLMAEVETDTTNVLLTLVRVWHTLETAEFTSKDAAADWAITRLDSPEAAPLARARHVYLGDAAEERTTGIRQARITARVLEDHIRQRADH